MLAIHITLAVLSLIWTTLTYVKPSLTKLNISYGLIYSVICTGVGLGLLDHAAIAQACTSGSAYLIVTIAATLYTRKKLAIQLTK